MYFKRPRQPESVEGGRERESGEEYLNQDGFDNVFSLITTSHSLWDIYLSHLSLLGNLEHDSDAILFPFFLLLRISSWKEFLSNFLEICAIHNKKCAQIACRERRKTILELPSRTRQFVVLLLIDTCVCQLTKSRGRVWIHHSRPIKSTSLVNGSIVKTKRLPLIISRIQKNKSCKQSNQFFDRTNNTLEVTKVWNPTETFALTELKELKRQIFILREANLIAFLKTTCVVRRWRWTNWNHLSIVCSCANVS